MKTNTITKLLWVSIMLIAPTIFGQSSQYSGRKKAAPAMPTKVDGKEKAAVKNESTASEKQAGDKLDVKDLENQYWAPKDTDFNVVQNRTYTKEKRFSLSLLGGPLINDAYSRAFSLGGAINYYFTERTGIEFTYINTPTENSKMVERFEAQGGLPNHSKVKDFYGLSFNWVPLYAKASVLGQKILYYDLAISPGLGITQYEEQIESGNKTKTAPAATLDITQLFFLSKNFALRFDFRNRWYQQEVANYRVTGAGAGTTQTDLETVNMILFGFTYYH